MGDKYNKKKAFERIKQMAKARDKKHGRLSQKEIDDEVSAVRHGKASKLAKDLENSTRIDTTIEIYGFKADVHKEGKWYIGAIDELNVQDQTKSLRELRSELKDAVDSVMKVMGFRVLVEKDEDGVYVGKVSGLPGCATEGKTKKKLMKNMREAIRAYLEDSGRVVKKNGKIIWIWNPELARKYRNSGLLLK